MFDILFLRINRIIYLIHVTVDIWKDEDYDVIGLPVSAQGV